MKRKNGIKKRFSYDTSFKLAVVNYAEERNNCAAAARNFNVSERQVRRWRGKKLSLQRMLKNKKAARGRSSFFPELEKYLCNWVMERRRKGFKVERTIIRREALHLVKDDIRFKSKKPEKFIASAGWCSRFLKRFAFCFYASMESNVNIKTRYNREIHKPLRYSEEHYISFNNENDESASVTMNDNIKDSLGYQDNSTEQQITNIYQKDLANIEAFYYARKKANKKLLKSQCTGNFKFKCLICEKIIENNINVMKHINAHINNQCQYKSTLSYVTRCKYCFQNFNTPFNMQCHIEAVHLKTNSLVCRICNQEFVQFEAFSLHMKKIHSQNEMPYGCPSCRYRSSFHQDIINHFNKIHYGTNKVLCHYCLKIFRIKFSKGIGGMQNYIFHLQQHQIKSRKCSSCCLIFVGLRELRKHKSRAHKLMIEHKGVKAFKSTFVKSLKEKLAEKSNITYPVTNVEYKRRRCNKADGFITSYFICYECNYPITFNHFGGFLSCGSCYYSTNCRKAFVDHVILKHSALKRKRKNNRINPKPTILKQPMSCLCGFTSLDGNSVASHLIYCRKLSCQITPAESISTVIQQAEDGYWHIYENNKQRNSHYSLINAKKNKPSLNLSKQNDISSEINGDDIINGLAFLPLKIIIGNEDKEINLSSNVENIIQNTSHDSEEKETEESFNMLNALGLISRSKSTIT